MSQIMVGVDGSDESVRAVRWAFAEAKLRREPVKLVYAIDWYALSEVSLAEPSADDVDKDVEAILDRAVEVAGGAPDGVNVHRKVLHAEDRRGPAGCLLDAAEREKASMIVVGTRGHRSMFSSSALGWVSHRVLQHARCPVVVVP